MKKLINKFIQYIVYRKGEKLKSVIKQLKKLPNNEADVNIIQKIRNLERELIELKNKFHYEENIKLGRREEMIRNIIGAQERFDKFLIKRKIDTKKAMVYNEKNILDDIKILIHKISNSHDIYTADEIYLEINEIGNYYQEDYKQSKEKLKYLEEKIERVRKDHYFIKNLKSYSKFIYDLYIFSEKWKKFFEKKNNKNILDKNTKHQIDIIFYEDALDMKQKLNSYIRKYNLIYTCFESLYKDKLLSKFDIAIELEDVFSKCYRGYGINKAWEANKLHENNKNFTIAIQNDLSNSSIVSKKGGLDLNILKQEIEKRKNNRN